jgi:hypothetical protein
MSQVPDGIVIWNLSGAGDELWRQLPIDEAEVVGTNGVLGLSFSPDNTRLLCRYGNRLLCWDIESGDEILDTRIQDFYSHAPRDLLGWLPDGNQVAILLANRSQRGEQSPRLAIQELGGERRLQEVMLHGAIETLSAHLVGDRVYVNDARANTLQVFSAALELESTYLLTSHGEETGVNVIHSSGAMQLDASLEGPLAVVLTDRGQETLPAADFEARYPSTR